MVDFYKYEDIKDSVLIKDTGRPRIPFEEMEEFIIDTNIWYTQNAMVFVKEEDIETIERNMLMVKLCEYYTLSNIFLSLIKEKDDVFTQKYLIYKQKYELYLTYMNEDTVTGNQTSIPKNTTENKIYTIGMKR